MKNSKWGQGWNRGMTLIETMTACVILTILMTVLIQGVLAASNWFAESNRIKQNGDKVANHIEGVSDATVSSNTQAISLGLLGEDSSISLANSENTKHAYAYDDISFARVATDVSDYIPSVVDPVYQTTRADVASIGTEINTILEDLMNGEGAKHGFHASYLNKDNTTWVNAIKAAMGGTWPVVSDEFMKRYHLSAVAGSMSGDLSIRAFLVNVSGDTYDFVYYICDNTASNNWQPYLIYDTESRCWYRCQKRNPADGTWVQNRYVSYTLAQDNQKYGLITATNNYTRFAYDNYIYLHEDPIEGLSSNSLKYNTSSQLLEFIRDEANGWEVMIPDE